MTETSDVDLITQMANGDGPSLMALYDRYNRLAFGLAYRILQNPTIAEEAVQDAFLQAWNRANTFDTSRGTNVRGWLMTIVHNRSIDIRRRDIDRKPRSVPLDDVEQKLSTPDAWKEVSANITKSVMRNAVAALPDDQRRTIELAYFEGLSQSEIAAQEQTPLGTVKGRMRLGIRKLRDSLDGYTPSAADNPMEVI